MNHPFNVKHNSKKILFLQTHFGDISNKNQIQLEHISNKFD